MQNLRRIVLSLLLCAGVSSFALTYFILSVPRTDSAGPQIGSTPDWDWRETVSQQGASDSPSLETIAEPDEPARETGGVPERGDDTDRQSRAAPDSRATAEGLARTADPVVARAAVNDLANFKDERGAGFLADLVFDSEVSDTVRMEAARALARMDSPNALDALLRATYSNIDTDPGEPVLHAVLRGLAAHHYGEAGSFINDLLAHPDMDVAAKTATIDAMSETPGSEALASLFEQARSDDPEVRESAIWAMAGRDDVHLAGAELFGLLEGESVPWVRASLYEALRYQDSVNVGALWDAVIDETSLSARLAGYQTIARHLPDAESARFDAEIVPELQTIATENHSLNERLSAIMTLGRAKTSEGAVEALLALRDTTGDDRVRRAAELALRP